MTNWNNRLEEEQPLCTEALPVEQAERAIWWRYPRPNTQFTRRTRARWASRCSKRYYGEHCRQARSS
jgi:hypothetical protein